MSSFTIKGKIKVVQETNQVSDKFKKREFVLIDESGQYPQSIQFECKQDKVSLLDEIKEGSEVSVRFNLQGREWINPQGETKYFNSLDCWAIDILDNIPEAIQKGTSEEEQDDLPF